MDEADALYAVRPEDFVAARSALVKQLKAEGRKDDAAAVAKLRRPSVAAWALNQVARTDPEVVSAAIDAGAALRAATEATVAGQAGEMRAATAAERAAANAVVKAAAEHLGARADALAPTLLATIRVAALDDEVADELRRGVLATDQEQPGFGFGMDLPVAPPAAPKSKAKPEAKKAAKPAKPAKGKPAGAEAAAEAERQRAEREAARAAERARKKELQARQRTADRRAREAARLAKEADEAEAEARAARAAAEAAQAEADAAAQAVVDLG